MPNPRGNNQHGEKLYPPDDVLRESLLSYGRRNLSVEEKLQALIDDHGLTIERRKFFILQKKLKIPTVRVNAISRDIRHQAVIDAANTDITHGNGPNFIRHELQQLDIPVSREEIRSIMLDLHPEGFDQRYPGRNSKKLLVRQPLECIGPFREVSGDGHEKLGALGLDMGGIGLPVYGFKDKFGAFVLVLQVLPQIRKPGPIGHLYLDMIEEYGGIPLQLTTDKGSETGWIYAIQCAIRATLCAEVDPAVFRDYAFLKSVHNTVIEAFWRWFKEKKGNNIKMHMREGKAIFKASVAHHTDLFNWMFPPLVQAELDKFRLHWNTHKIRTQAGKMMPSGHSPDEAMRHPERYGGMNCMVPVPQVIVDEIRLVLDEEVGTREENFRWVTAEFSALAEEVYDMIGRPTLTLATAWPIFQSMIDTIETLP